jgi:Zn-dependent peptidase ImmA (M78 family)
MRSRQRSSPENRAQELLDRLNLHNIPVPVERIARELGAEIRYSPLDDELSGFIYIKDDVPIIGVNSQHHPNRQRFTIAHEIGHFELHRTFISRQVHVDKSFPVSRRLSRDEASATGTERIEIQANQFAATLLMPENYLRRALEKGLFDIDDDSLLTEVARQFRVSKQALEYRIRNLY